MSYKLPTSRGNKVRFWHLADVSLALANVCFEGKNGHDAGVTPFPLVTQSGCPMPSKGNTQLRKEPHSQEIREHG